MRRLVLTGDHATAGYPSRSEATMATARSLRSADADDAEIEYVFRSFPVAAEVAEKGPRRLARLLDAVRAPAPTPETSKVRVMRVRRHGDGRVGLRLQVVSGPGGTRRWWQHVAAFPALWERIRAAAGLGPARPPATWTDGLLGCELEVRVRARPGWGLEVAYWLPSAPRDPACVPSDDR